MEGRVLVIDDEPAVREALKQVIEYEGLEVQLASSGREGLLLFPEFRPHVVVLDVKMAGLDGLEVLSKLKAVDPGVAVVMISGHGTIATAVQATQRGAFDFLEKPLDSDRLMVTLRNALSSVALSGENERLKGAIDTKYPMVGSSSALRAVRDLIGRVGPTDSRVLITGENGTGKELVARAIHEASRRRERAFIEVNCAAIPNELIESELFGHIKGSFTGAVADRPGKFELADGGTLFLDEIGDMSLSAQAKVLRVLQQGVVTRIGGARPQQVDVRVLAATNKVVAEEIAEGRFREDLYYRLNVVPIVVPPIRQRREDIPELIAHFVEQLAGRGGIPVRTFTTEAVDKLKNRAWPGNVRELRNAIERLLILARTNSVTGQDVERLIPPPLPAEESASLGRSVIEAERAQIVQALAKNDWNIAETARALAMPRSNLYKKIEKYQISREST
ncbi:MAG: sigma-54-dependent Fis family transcriptional regulator [Gemmatimonadetes bacterium]|uniref:Sigma-54-dependent Fis family transcriptional regulator n=1 Tax=Candidatus Tanganyikabacteria bacterium TaxID=2961651 RepID=A0A938BMG7_9BACT|nr:sigma-54-dependent Fis family transcriptional regulator [Candidatus Tanganyikabacteria bacterium]MBM4187277.1 sigma-54-dependent Fis family transcriptional regulator [Gemmatimonadota bacterium]